MRQWGVNSVCVRTPSTSEVSDGQKSHTAGGQDERLIRDRWWHDSYPLLIHTMGRTTHTRPRLVDERCKLWPFVISVMKPPQATGVDGNQTPLQGSVQRLMCGLSGCGCSSSFIKGLTRGPLLSDLGPEECLIQPYKSAGVTSLLQPLVSYCKPSGGCCHQLFTSKGWNKLTWTWGVGSTQLLHCKLV